MRNVVGQRLIGSISALCHLTDARPHFTNEAFARHWMEDQRIRTEDNLRVGINRPDSPRIKEAPCAQTEQARSRGVSASPSFVVDNEVLWGDDRPAQAIAWGRA